MIDIIFPSDLRRLADMSGAYCVSIHLPTHGGGVESTQDPIRFKNLLAQARRELDSLGIRRQAIDTLLSAATALHDDRDFWASTESGLAVFTNPDGIWAYRLPTAVVELAVVAERFHLKPLLPTVATDEVFYVLALSENHVRVLRGNKLQLSEIALGDIPESLAESLRFDDREPQLQSHAGGRVGGGRVVAAFHGQGGRKDARGVDRDRFLTAVDSGFRDIVRDASAPLVLAGVDDVVSHFRKVSHYAHIVSGHIGGNPEMVSAPALHEDAWALVRPLLEVEQHAASESIASGSVPTLTALAGVVVAAHDGRIGALFVQQGVQRWGTFDTEQRTTDVHETRLPGDRDLLDIAAIETLNHGGKVFVVPESELPSATPIAAALRH